MVKAEWGTKRNCPKCGAKFYDLKKNPAECPACHLSFDPEALQKKKPKRKSGRSSEDAKAKALGSAAKKKAIDGEDQDIDLPEFEDLEIIEDIDDIDAEVLEEVEAIPTKTGTADEDEADEEAFLEDGDIEIEDEDDEDK